MHNMYIIETPYPRHNGEAAAEIKNHCETLAAELAGNLDPTDYDPCCCDDYDGHGAAEWAKFVKENPLTVFMSELKIFNEHRMQYLAGGEWKTEGYILLVVVGGPNIEINTHTSTIRAVWGDDVYEREYNDRIGFNAAAMVHYETSSDD